jgi:putative DNA primase/helicase
LAPPPAVLSATEAYFNEQDVLAGFVADCCMTDDPNAGEDTGDLHIACCQWCETEGKSRLSQQTFSERLDAIGFKKTKNPETRRSRFLGIRLIRAESWF